MRHLLAQGNAKVGRGVYVWNLPVYKTCPGSTDLCRSVCYADRGYFRYPRNRALNEARLQAAESDDFVDAMRRELDGRGVTLLRLHSSGDFFSSPYIRKWEAILGSTPAVRAWAYTRSWRLPDLLPDLKTLAKLPNMRLQFSADQETGLPPLVEGVEVNFLQVEEEVISDATGQVKLVWRTRREGRAVAKRLALPLAPTPALICPNYQGTGDRAGHSVTCEQCRFCLE